MKQLAGFVVGLAGLAVAGAIYAYGGFYNVAAVEPHAALTDWVLHTTMQQSVKARARTITPPPPPGNRDLGEAFRGFDEMCVQCHGAPGKEPGVVGKGLQPPPPGLGDAAKRWNRAELFWIVKNGIRMTGMPAFGPTHSDEQIWALVAFLQRLPNTSAAQYKEMEKQYAARGKEAQPAQKGQEHKH